MGKRIFLFLLVNFLVIISISVITSVFGLSPYLTQYGINYTSLAVFCLIWGMAGSFISLGLSKWMAKQVYKIKIINPSTMDVQERALINMVHMAAQKAGISKMPEVGIYESIEVNAFATGPTKNRSLVAVSTGLLRSMNSSAVEGVIGHEVAHIANGDMVTMTLLQGIVNAFVMFLSRAVAYAIMQSSGRDNKGGGYFMYYAVQIALEIVLMILGSAVIAFYSRVREYSADKGGAELVGKQKMILALQGLQNNYQLNYKPAADPKTDSFKVFQISNPSKWSVVFSTHPSLEDRIKRLSQTQI